MKVAVGGTFNVLHRGHQVLLDRAFEIGDEVLVGITSDAMASKSKGSIRPLWERKADLERFLRTKGTNWTVAVIDRPDEQVDVRWDIFALIVSPETRRTGEAINVKRYDLGLPPLKLVEVPHVLADDFMPIAARRILAGEIDTEGHLLRPLRVNVGSINPVKSGAVNNVLSRFYRRLEVRSVDVPSGVPDQPWGGDTRQGAINRASLAMGDGDLSIGLEAGVFETADGLYDVQYCAILDRRGRYSIGHGMGFRYPTEVAELVRQGKMVGTAVKELYGSGIDGRREGAIGYLTGGAMDRTKLAEQAVMAAMVPRLRKELYYDI